MTEDSPGGEPDADNDNVFSKDGSINLSLSTWMGISGAAISTGLGQNSSLGLSLLAGLLNLRLGVWWRPKRERAQLYPNHWVQAYLLREFLGWFKGPRKANSSSVATGWKPWKGARRLYLTDGGHYDNTGVYELVRRRVPFIIACDNGADPDYRFADIVNLTRKLRIDFDASLEFLDKEKLNGLLGKKSSNRGMFGEFSELVAFSKDRRSHGPYAAIARIKIPKKMAEINGEKQEIPVFLGTMILIKPRLSGFEMIDIMDYRHGNERFPQQSTGDQFFDESQWESYYRLGHYITGLIFADPGSAPDAAAEGERDAVSESEPDASTEGERKPRKRWKPHELEPIGEEHVDWFGDDWIPKASTDDNGKDCTPCNGKSAVAAAGSGSAPGGLLVGLGPVITSGVASLGALGALFGINHTLTTTPTTTVEERSAKSDTSVTLKLDDETRLLFKNGIKVDIDAGLIQRLNMLLVRLNLLISRQTIVVTGGNTDLNPVVAELRSIHDLLGRFLATQDPGVLRRLLAEVQALRADERVRGQTLAADLAVLHANLVEVADRVTRVERATAAVEDAVRTGSPRRNARSGQ